MPPEPRSVAPEPLSAAAHAYRPGVLMPGIWHALFWILAFWSGLAPADRLTWCLEVAPAGLFYAATTAFRHRYRWTPLAAACTLFLIAIIFVGGHYGFGSVPGFYGSRQLPAGLGTRNEFDKFAHFFQGFVPAILFRELLIRFCVLSGPRFLAIIITALSLALSAAYELCEWASHIALGSRADTFLAMQDDPWDAQSDMALALLGALTALLTLSRFHDTCLALGKGVARKGMPKKSFDKLISRG